MIKLQNVSLEFPIYGHEPRMLTKKILSLASAGKFVRNHKIPYVRSVDNLSLDIKVGERVGLIGNNGAGKTSILKLMAGIYQPTHGSIHAEGTIFPILGSGFGLDHEATGYENIVLGGIALGHSVKTIQEKIPEIEEFTELGEFLHMPLKTYSAGMMTRLAFAITTSIKSDILVIDEGIGAGDKDFNTKAQKRLDQFLQEASILVLASHSEELIKKFCTHGLVMKGGKKQFYGPIKEALEYYKDRY